MTTLTKSGLYEKLLEAQREAAAVEKRGRNEAQGYAYAQASDVIEEAQRALHEAGLVGYMEPGEIREREIESQGGSAGIFVTVISTLIIVDPDSGDSLSIPMRGTGVDYPGDKAIYKALTGAAKYAYASALGIPFGDDPEAEVAGSGQARKSAAQGEASPAQKRLITTILNRAGVDRELQRQMVHALAGNPPTKAGASEILDEIADKQGDPAALEHAIGALFERAEISLAESQAAAGRDLPVDEEAVQGALPDPGADQPDEFGPDYPGAEVES